MFSLLLKDLISDFYQSLSSRLEESLATVGCKLAPIVHDIIVSKDSVTTLLKGFNNLYVYEPQQNLGRGLLECKTGLSPIYY